MVSYAPDPCLLADIHVPCGQLSWLSCQITSDGHLATLGSLTSLQCLELTCIMDDLRSLQPLSPCRRLAHLHIPYAGLSTAVPQLFPLGALTALTVTLTAPQHRELTMLPNLRHLELRLLGRADAGPSLPPHLITLLYRSDVPASDVVPTSRDLHTLVISRTKGLPRGFFLRFPSLRRLACNELDCGPADRQDLIDLIAEAATMPLGDLQLNLPTQEDSIATPDPGDTPAFLRLVENFPTLSSIRFPNGTSDTEYTSYPMTQQQHCAVKAQCARHGVHLSEEPWSDDVMADIVKKAFGKMID